MDKITELEIAREVQYNNKAEAQAIEDYTDFLDKVERSSLEEEDKDFIRATINEIISDEMNHQERLQELYSLLSSIEPNKN